MSAARASSHDRSGPGVPDAAPARRRDWLQWIQSRNQAGPFVRGALNLTVALWKRLRTSFLASWFRPVLTVDGHRMQIRGFSYDDLLTISADYEPLLATWLPPRGGVAIDAGAYVGRHTLAYARAVGPRGRVLACEPLPENFRLLRGNVSRNGYVQVVCEPCALSDLHGEGWLHFEQETSSASTIYGRASRVAVPLRTLDDLCRKHGIKQVDLLKVDVEGAELNVLQGAAAILRASPHALLIVEMHSSERFQHDPTPLVQAWLRERGYQWQDLRERGKRFFVARKAQAQSLARAA